MRIQCVSLAVCVIGAALAPPAAGQQWEVFFDSESFEALPLGPLNGTTPAFLPHRLSGHGSGSPEQLPTVVSSPDPAVGARSIRLQPVWHEPWDASSLVGYVHHSQAFGRREFAFPGAARSRGGYRSLRISFDLYHGRDPEPGTVSWIVGGVKWFLGEPTAQLVWDVTEPLQPVFDEWVHVSITYDFENDLISGSYAAHESPPAPLPAQWRETSSWKLSVTAGTGDPPGPAPWIESVWLDNLVIEVIPPCPADCDIDYAHTFFDFLCFQNMFAAGNMRADCDLDGDLTVFDFLCFQNYFAAGCE